MANSIPSTKPCRTCNVERQFSDFRDINCKRSGKVYPANTCKPCHKARYSRSAGYKSPRDRAATVAAHARMAQRTETRAQQPYQCIRCDEVKPRSQFSSLPSGRRYERCMLCVEVIAERRIAKPCCVCGVVTETKSMNGLYCLPCFKITGTRAPEAKRIQRAKYAAIKGKRYTPGHKGGYYDLAAIAERKAARRAGIERRKAERLALIVAEPWRAPLLTSAERFALRYRMDPEFNLKQRLRAALKRKRQGIRLGDMLRSAIARCGTSPIAEQFVGYTAKDMRAHIERQFSKGMTWDAFCEGRIHIDHIVPLSSFNVSDANELKAAWALTNLRPLWAKDNLAKRDRRTHLL